MTHELDLRLHPEFDWHVTDQAIGEYLFNIKGVSLEAAVGHSFIDENGVKFKKIGAEQWRLKGFETKTVKLLGFDLRLQEDLCATITNIIIFARKVKDETETTSSASCA